MGAFTDLKPEQIKTGGAFDDLKITIKNKYLSGGLVSDVGDIISTGQYATTGFLEKQLEKSSILKPSATGIFAGVQKRKSNIDLLRRIGADTGRGGLLTGQYTFKPTSFWHNFVRELPVATLGILGDIFLDPLLVLGKFGMIAKATGKIGGGIKLGAKSLAKEVPVVQKIGDALGRLVIPRFGETKILSELDKERIITEALQSEKNMKLTDTLIESPKAIQLRINQILRGGISVSEKEKPFRLMAQAIRDEIDKAGKIISDINPDLLSEATFKKGKGNYLTYLYTKYVSPTEEILVQKGLGLFGKKTRIPTDQFRPRMDFTENLSTKIKDFFNLPRGKRNNIFRGTEVMPAELNNFLTKNAKYISREEFFNQPTFGKFSDFYNARIRKDLGLIEEAGLPALQTLEKEGKAAIRVKFFDDLVQKGVFSELPTVTKRFQLPSSASLGKAADKFATRADFENIMRTIDTPSAEQQLWLRGLRLWKAWKTAYNPATIGRNDLTNFLVLNPLGGVNPWRLDIYYKSLRDWHRNGELWQAFKRAGGGLQSQASAELLDRATKLYKSDTQLQKTFAKVSDYHNAVVKFYGSQDTIFKFVNFVKGVAEDGLSQIDAMKRAKFYLVDYSEMPLIVNWLKQSPIGAPFISFTYGVSLPFAKTMLEHPEKLANYAKILRGMQSLGADIKVDPKELPDKYKEQPYSALKLPFKDKFGRPQFLDMRYIIPFNVLEVYSQNKNSLGQVPVLGQLFGNNPLIQIFSGLVTNKNPYTGKEIVNSGSTSGEAVMASMDYVQKTLLPSLSPQIPVRVNGKIEWGGFSLSKIASALQGRPDYAGRDRDLMATLFDVLAGIKVEPLDTDLQLKINKSQFKNELEDIAAQIFKIRASRILKDEEKSKEIERLKVKLNNIRNEFDKKN